MDDLLIVDDLLPHLRLETASFPFSEYSESSDGATIILNSIEDDDDVTLETVVDE